MIVHWFVDGPRSGAENMALDREAWRTLEDGGPPSVLVRTYAWKPAALSLGFHQSLEEVSPSALAELGIDVVHRPTGGAAVLHDEEITYSVCAPLGLEGLGRRVLEIYDSLASALSSSLGEFGLDCSLGGGGRPQGFACFSAAGGHELTVGGRKLVGSALRRGRSAFLQHGSLLEGPGHLRLFDLLGSDSGTARGARNDLARRTVHLQELGIEVDRRSFTSSLAREIARRIGGTAVEVSSLGRFRRAMGRDPGAE